MALFKKRCTYYKKKIEKEVWIEVKIPEFTGRRLQPFCSEEHAEFYKKMLKKLQEQIIALDVVCD